MSDFTAELRRAEEDYQRALAHYQTLHRRSGGAFVAQTEDALLVALGIKVAVDPKDLKRLLQGPSRELVNQGDVEALKAEMYRGPVGEYVAYQYAWAWRKHVQQILNFPQEV